MVFLKRHKAHVSTNRYGDIIRGYGRGPFFYTIKYKSGATTEEIYDEQGLRSQTWYKPNETVVTRYVRRVADYGPRKPGDPDIPVQPRNPRKTPKLAGPKGPLPG